MNLFDFFSLIYSIKAGRVSNLEEIEKRGLLAVKIAQHLALRLDFFKTENCLKLAQLFTQDLPKNPLPINSILPLDYQKNFKHISPSPFASASVGQVHQAITLNDEKVVIKIIKKDYRQELKKDVKNLRAFFKTLELVLPQFKNIFDPVAIIEYIEHYTLEELDLLNEIKGKSRLEELKNQSTSFYNLDQLKFPAHFQHLSSERILVTEEIIGSSLKTLLETKQLAYENLLDLFRIHGFYIFFHGEFHGDLHPGNILLNNKGQFYFIDTAALSTTSLKIKKHLLELFLHLTEYDYPRAAATLELMAETPLKVGPSQKFQKDFCYLYKDFKDKTVAELSLTKQMMDSIKLAINSGMSFDQSMFPIIKSLSYLDGMVIRCHPKANLIRDMKPAVEKLYQLQ